MSKKIISSLLVLFLLLGFMALTAFAAEEAVSEGDVGTASKADLEKVHPTKPPYSPYAGRNFPTRPLFSDTHLHTAFSGGAVPRPTRTLPPAGR